VTRPGFAARFHQRESGFTLLEVMIVVALALVVTATAVPVSRNLILKSKATSTAMEVATWFETARNRSAAERRNFEMTFDTTQRSIQIQRVESSGSKTLIMLRQLPDNVAFIKFSFAPDTPDAFGAASAIDFDGPSPYMFTSEGMFVDANGDPSNGTIFMGKSNQNDTGTAITVFGATGLLRTWRLSGKTWIR
jgi:prepilin-type N-terminal cleavage/methylation domain-containing protein